MKLVSTRLKAVVCEFAMLPEMFSSAKRLCAKSRHRGGECTENTHTVLQPDRSAARAAARSGEAVASRVPCWICWKINELAGPRGAKRRRGTA
jgi:hypothetical protein